MKFPVSILVLAAGILPASLSRAATLSTFNFDAGSLAVSSELFPGSSGNINLGASWSVNTTTERLDAPLSGVGTGINTGAHRFTFVYTVTGLDPGKTLNLTGASVAFTGASNTVRFNTYINGSTIGSNNNPPNSGTYTPSFSVLGLENGDTVSIGFALRANTNAGTVTADNYNLFGDVVPEPSSSLLLMMGGAVLALRRRRS